MTTAKIIKFFADIFNAYPGRPVLIGITNETMPLEYHWLGKTSMDINLPKTVMNPQTKTIK